MGWAVHGLPGRGKLPVNAVAAVDGHDVNDAGHREPSQHTRELSPIGGSWRSSYREDVFERAGFCLRSSEGRSAEGMIRKERALHDRFNAIAGALARMHLIPGKVDTTLQRMNTKCAPYLAAEEEEPVTLNWRCLVQKPARTAK